MELNKNNLVTCLMKNFCFVLLSFAIVQIHAQVEPRNPRVARLRPGPDGTRSTIPVANGDFERGQIGWTGTVARYTGPSAGEPVLTPAALAELKQIGGNYWQGLGGVAASPLLLPVQGQWYGSNVQSSIFTLLLPGETIAADPIARLDAGTPLRAAPAPAAAT